jgi:type IV secretory pathway VirB2 component (pilin)
MNLISGFHMILFATSISGSSEGTLVTAISWIESMLLGSAATSIAVLAVAMLGAGMLWGHLDLRAAARISLGAFILFGAPLIAYQMTTSLRGSPVIISDTDLAAPPSLPAPQMPKNAPVQDPYAGASVPQLQP